MIIFTLALILGLLLGFYGRQVYDLLMQLLEDRREAIEARNVGVVRPVGSPVTKNQPIDLSSDTGPVMKPTPAAVEDLRQAERAKVLRENHQ